MKVQIAYVYFSLEQQHIQCMAIALKILLCQIDQSDREVAWEVHCTDGDKKKALINDFIQAVMKN